MANRKTIESGTCNAFATARPALAISLKATSPKILRNSGAKTSGHPLKFGRNAGLIAESIYARVSAENWPELSAELFNRQSLLISSLGRKLSAVSELFLPALRSGVPFWRTALVPIHPTQRATEFRREHAPLAGHLRRHHDERCATCCVSRFLGSQADD
ncbi:hypothetical protein NK553_23215 [Pseudomonas sp. ZM23]|uniref:Uncharacterized protein n=1 Tax=Pseudomonas triclosanedens TaxID=2961893 RepID=A0ABY6ZX50_9PSED|nr:hypothetical protein [Pseudomonas triclosanedens]MCP8466868.1 hypothetical protein [Pseudomonas triclosanedens]MCP8470092.1 hypothetical protein [Pseudomonas triclosanedens]MCP8478002.1 hypothetical protein [Pseudomonas triclosanedens]WAI49416.1 hypothetical protein OU419_27390 [Pseudomonas triclosanedens]